MVKQLMAEPISAPEATYDGFYLRNNLGCTGAVPSSGPYDLCPDIIQSNEPIPDAQSALSTLQSWGTTYSTEPIPGQTNYYYVRGMNGGSKQIASRVSLYSTPAQLIMLPTTWKNNALVTSQGLEYVNVQADPGHIGVGDDVFVWQQTPILADGSDFYSFVAQVNDAENSNPIPSVTSWLDMGQLLTNNLGFGFRNTCYVDGKAATWCHRLQLNVPTSIGNPGQLQILIAATGFAGNTVALVGDTIPANKIPILFEPQVISSDTFLAGITITPEAGFASSLAVQYWNDAGKPPATGATIAVLANYIVPESEIDKAGNRGLLNPVYCRYVQNALHITPQTIIALGAATFVATE